MLQEIQQVFVCKCMRSVSEITACAERGENANDSGDGGGKYPGYVGTRPPDQGQTEHSGCVLQRTHYNLT